jgi:WD40 repeat protein
VNDGNSTPNGKLFQEPYQFSGISEDFDTVDQTVTSPHSLSSESVPDESLPDPGEMKKMTELRPPCTACMVFALVCSLLCNLLFVLPAAASTNGKIAFASNRDGNAEIYVMDPDGRNQIDLTTHGARDADPAWSPDGRQIAFTSFRDGNFELYIMDVNSRKTTRLTDNPADDSFPAWSPDGEKIAFQSKRDGNWEICVMNADGSNQKRLTNHMRDNNHPAWGSPGVPQPPPTPTPTSPFTVVIGTGLVFFILKRRK